MQNYVTIALCILLALRMAHTFIASAVEARAAARRRTGIQAWR